MRNQYEDEADPPRDPVVQQWFECLDAPPEAQEPPGARLRMLAQIDQRRKPSWVPSWWPSIATPVVATGLAIGLLLSLGLNMWLGRHFVGTSRFDARPIVAARTGSSEPVTPLSIYRFQTRMHHLGELRVRLTERLPKMASTPVVGFTPQARRTAFFRLGRLYADALAALHNTTAETAVQYLARLLETLARVQAPSPLSEYLEVIHQRLQEQPQQLDPWRLILAGFEPLYRDAYAMTDPAIEWMLFELGAWLENLYLAAVTGDVDGLQQGQTLEELRQPLEALGLPPRAMASLSQLQALLHQPNLGTSDMVIIQSHIQMIQDILGE